VSDAAGNSLRVAYDDRVPPLSFGKDPGIKGYALSRISVTGPREPRDPATMTQAEYGDVGWVTVGLPWGNGDAGQAGSRFPGAAERYAWSCEQKEEIRRLDTEFTRVHESRGNPPKAMLANVMDLAAFCRGIKLALEAKAPKGSPDYAFLGDRTGIGYRALASQLLRLAHWPRAETTQTGALPAPVSPAVGGIRMCSCSAGLPTRLPQALWGFSLFGDEPAKEQPSGWYEYCDNLPYFNPRTASYSCNPGSQNLGYSTQPSPTPTKRSSDSNFDNNQKYSGAVVKVFDKAHKVATVPQPYAVQLTVVQEIIKFDTKMYKYAGDAIENVGHDPPRDDYDQIAHPQVPDFPPLQVDESLPTLKAGRQFYDAHLAMTAILRAFCISQDRHGGAVRAGEGKWAAVQAVAMVEYQRQAGEAMVRTADALKAWIDACRAERIPELWVTPELLREGHDELAAQGFSAEEVAVARKWGMSDEEIEEVRQSLLKTEPPTQRIGFLTSCGNLARAMRNLGEELRLLPEMPLP